MATTRSQAALSLFAVALTACVGSIDAPAAPEAIDDPALATPSAPGPKALAPFKPAPLGLRRLLGWQYRNAVRDLLGAGAAAKITVPADSSVNGFDSVGSAQLAVAATAVEAYETSALAAAQAALSGATRAALVGCTPARVDDAVCLKSFISRFGRRAFRRTLSADELADWIALGQKAGLAYKDFHQGLAFVISGLLQSPFFVYQVELGEPDPADATRLRLTSVEMATRLAFFVTGTLPSDSLLDAAEAGELATEEGVRRWTKVLLVSPDARNAMTSFFDELLKLRELGAVQKNATAYPTFTASLKASMRRETELLVEDVIWEQNGDFRDLLDSSTTFVDKALATHYGVPFSGTQAFVKVSLSPASLRGGILGQGSFLSTLAHPTTTSPTLRGKFIRETLMCQAIGAPPPNVKTVVEPDAAGAPATTMREKLARHQKDPYCAKCHVLMDNLGLGLENFDAVGGFRTRDNGALIDAKSTIPELGGFTGARELGGLLRADPAVTECMVRNVFRHATGHIEAAGEERSIVAMHGRFKDQGFRVQQLIVEIAASDAFRFASPGGDL